MQFYAPPHTVPNGLEYLPQHDVCTRQEGNLMITQFTEGTPGGRMNVRLKIKNDRAAEWIRSRGNHNLQLIYPGQVDWDKVEREKYFDKVTPEERDRIYSYMVEDEAQQKEFDETYGLVVTEDDIKREIKKMKRGYPDKGDERKRRDFNFDEYQKFGPGRFFSKEDNVIIKSLEKESMNRILKISIILFLSGGIITGIVFLSIFLYKKFKSKDKKSVK